MNLRVAFTSFMVFTSIALILYGMSSYLNALLGWQQSLFNEVWKLVAIAVGASILSGFLFPRIRGVKKGDYLLAMVSKQLPQGNFFESLIVIALEDGKKGRKIKVRLANGSLGEGIVTGYAGTITPPTIELTEIEKPNDYQG